MTTTHLNTEFEQIRGALKSFLLRITACTADAEDIVVPARVRAAFSPVTPVNLNYRVMFGSVVQVPMLDDGSPGS